MRRTITLILTAGIMFGTTHVAQAKPTEGRWRGPCSTWQYGEHLTPTVYHEDPAKGQAQIRRLIICVFHHWAPGNESHALYVADRESSLYPWAQNPSSLCSGLFQHILSAWPARVDAYLWKGWFSPSDWKPSVFDARANAIVAARMVHSGGWGPWGG